MLPTAQATAPFPPSSGLVDDVLREIFLWCIQVQASACPRLGGLKLKCALLPQLSVSRVCSAWRHVALGTPRLWSAIRFESMTDRNFTIAQRWLSRAKGVPIRIRIDFFSTSGGTRWEEKLTDLLSAHSLRDIHFQLDADEGDALHEILASLPSSSVASLRTLDAENIGQSTFSALEVDSSRYPKLSYLSLRGDWRLDVQSHFLRVFDGVDAPLSIAHCWDVLRGFPSLEDCRLALTMNDGRQIIKSHPSGNKIRLPRLRVLRVYFRDGAAFETFIEPLSVPSLETFATYGSAVKWSAQAFLSMARQSDFFPNLTGLTVKKSGNEIDANVIFEALPTLTALSLVNEGNLAISINSETLEGLSCGRLCPKLQKIELSHLPDVHAFLDMAESRLRNARGQGDATSGSHEELVPFAHVAISARGNAHGDIRGRVQELSDKGLDIKASIQSSH